MSPEALFLSSKNGAACMYPTQDSALGMWALTFFSPSCPPLVLDRAFVEDLLFVAYPKRRSTVVARAARLQRQWDQYSADHRDSLEVCVMNHVAALAPATPLRAPFIYTGYGLLSMLMPQVRAPEMALVSPPRPSFSPSPNGPRFAAAALVFTPLQLDSPSRKGPSFFSFRGQLRRPAYSNRPSFPFARGWGGS